MGKVVYLDQIPVHVTASAVVCPIAMVSSYLNGEIFSEGSHRKDVPWWVVLPREDVGRQSLDWVDEQIAAIEQLRQSSVNPYLIHFEGRPLDIGLVDVRVFMDIDNKSDIKRLLESDSSRPLKNRLPEHNNLHVDMLIGSALHDQMVIFQTLHMVDASGNLRLHFHNIVLDLRRRGDAIGFLDMNPILNALSKKVAIGFIAGKSQSDTETL